MSTEKKTCVISYVMLDCLEPIGSPIHKRIRRTKATIIDFIMEIADSYRPAFPGLTQKHYDSLGRTITDRYEAFDAWLEKYPDKKDDPSNFFSGYISFIGKEEAFNREHAETVAESLLERGYWVANRVNKYYVVAFALDGTEFDVYSKDCDPREIEWGADIPAGEHTGPVLTPEDNVNPVIAAVAAARAQGINAVGLV
jgi:hypothetical protein